MRALFCFDFFFVQLSVNLVLRFIWSAVAVWQADGKKQ